MADLPTDEMRRALADRIDRAIVPQRLRGDPDIKVIASWETWQQILASLRAKTAGRAGEWQPMETAPKDGTLFLAYAEAGQHGLPAMYSLCAWHPDAGFCIDELREPTHWKPLDPSPQGEGGGE